MGIVVNPAQFAKFVHEEADACPGRSNHLRKRSLADLLYDRLWRPFLAEIRQQQEHTGKAFLARIEQLVDEIRFAPDRPIQKMRDEHLGEGCLLVDYPRHNRLFDAHDNGFRQGCGRRQAARLPGKAFFAKEFVRSKDPEDGFLAILRNNRGLHLAFLDVEDLIGRVSLRKDDLVLGVLAYRPALAYFGEKSLRTECRFAFDRYGANSRDAER